MSRAEAFGRVVRKERLKRGLSQEVLAEVCGLHRNAVGLLERGERAPNLDTIVEIATGLGLRPSKLIALLEREVAAQLRPLKTRAKTKASSGLRGRLRPS
jgi:transcriptional regulator with XRE-family HTH domain